MFRYLFLTLSDMCGLGLLNEEQVVQFFGWGCSWSFSWSWSCTWFFCSSRGNSNLNKLKPQSLSYSISINSFISYSSQWSVSAVFTFDSDFGLAELTASLIGSLAQVIPSIVFGGRAYLQRCCSIREADPGAAT